MSAAVHTGQVDFLIVGQGLAGSAVSVELLRRGKAVKVFDLPSENHCSVIAAGLFNPVTGRMPELTWRAPEVFDALEKFYPASEELTTARFFYPTPLYRPFVNEEERSLWLWKSEEKGLKPFVKKLFTAPSGERGVNDPFGGLLLDRCGFVDVPSFLLAVRRYLADQSAFVEACFQPSKLEWRGSYWIYDGHRAGKVVLCQGLFSPLDWNIPVRPLKGETLTVRLPETPRWIYNRGVYVVPVPGTSNFKVGATYNRSDNKQTVTPQAREELLQKTRQLLTVPFEEVNQEWGIRPTSPDRRPLVGALPGYQNLFALNGLGTKGVSLAPYAAGALVRHLVEGSPIDEEMDLSRYY